MATKLKTILVLLTALAVAHSGIIVIILTAIGISPSGWNKVLASLNITPAPECSMSTPQLIQHYGYPVEQHRVKTEDNYTLTMFRIPHGINGTTGKEAVFLQHCLLCSSNDWLILPPTDALPYLLADQGYDVWMGNCRGNNYSMMNDNFTPNDTEFWDFSFHEMGIYDLPAEINYVLNTTDRIANRATGQISYIGHSMGTSMFFVAMVRHPELQPRIRKMIALAPGAYLANIETPIGVLAQVPSPALTGLLNMLSGGRLIPDEVNKYLKVYGPVVCNPLFSRFCAYILYLVAGFNPTGYPSETLCMITGHTPSDASGKTLAHYLQLVNLGVIRIASGALECENGLTNQTIQPAFREYDYGCRGNLIKYNCVLPPVYNLTEITVETLVIYGSDDWIIVPVDAQRACNELGNLKNCTKVNNYNHLDFIYASDAKVQVYDQCLSYLAVGAA